MAIQMRITQNAIADRVMAGLQGNLSRLGKLQEQLSSGKMVSKPSDSPTGTYSSMHLRAQVRSAQQYSRNAENGLGWLATADTTLTSGLDQMRRVRDLTLQGMSGGAASSPAAREALAVEVDNIRESLIALGNTRYLDRPVFGGTTTGPAAYDANGAYIGDSGSVQRTVADGVQVRVDLTGPEVFGTGATQVFTLLEDIASDLRTAPQDLDSKLGRLDTAMNNMLSQISDIGARYNRVEGMRQTADNRVLTLRSQLSDVEDIDLPGTIMELKLQETAYQAALAATARVVQPSLLDFLR